MEVEGEQQPPMEDQAAMITGEQPPAEAEDPLGAGALGASEPKVPVTMGAAENYESMSEDEKRCFESFVASQMDGSLVG